MPLTLGEFLHPLGTRTSQRNLVLACMYYLHRYDGVDAMTTAQIESAFKKAKHTQGKKIQIAAVLNKAVPYAYSPAGKVQGERIQWALTDTGFEYVRELLDLPTAEPEREHEVGALQKLASKIGDEHTRTYVEEAVLCLSVGALRSSIVFLWTGAVATLRERVWNSGGASTIDAALKKHNPKARDFHQKDDFAYVKDADLLQIAEDLRVLDKSQKTVLKQALDLRNQCGHPVKYSPGEKRASAFVEDLISIVWP